jgi:outer membrane immunogenic protein
MGISWLPKTMVFLKGTMRNPKLITLGAVAFGAVGVCAASAADLSARRYSKAPAMVAAPVYSWSGCYLGGNVGGGWSTHTGDRGIINAGNATLNAGIGVPVTLGTGSGGVIGGAQIGCNYQNGPIVFGVETDIQGSGLRGNSMVYFPSPDGGITDATTSRGGERINWFGTARARVGFTPANNFLLYGTAGFAYGGVNSSATLVLTPAAEGNYAGATSETKFGWTAGMGGEYAFANNWSAKLEYLYLDIGTTAVRMVDPGRPATFIDYAFRHRDNIVRVGLNYHFGGPVVARY